MDYYTKLLIGVAVLLILSALAIYLAGKGRSDKRQGGRLIDARMREGYTYAAPLRSEPRALSLGDAEGAYYAWDRVTSRKRPYPGV